MNGTSRGEKVQHQVIYKGSFGRSSARPDPPAKLFRISPLSIHCPSSLDAQASVVGLAPSPLEYSICLRSPSPSRLPCATTVACPLPSP